MYRFKKPRVTTITVNQSYAAETIEQKIRRMLNNKEMPGDGAETIYTKREDGVQPLYDVRADRWDIALDAMDKASRDNTAKREERIKEAKEKREGKVVKMPENGDKAEGKSTDGTKSE